MTELLESALHNCALTHYLEKFKDNDVDDNVLKTLTDCAAGSMEERLLAEIVPSVGHRLKLIAAVREVSQLRSSKLNLQRFSCSICGSYFASFKDYWIHVRDVHEITGNNGRVRLNCPLCSMVFTCSFNLKKHVERQVCPVIRSFFSNYTHTENIDDVNTMSNINQEIFSPQQIQEVNADYKLIFVKSLQMSGGISLSKCNDILCAANSLVNSIIEIAKQLSIKITSPELVVTKLNTLKDPFPSNNSSQYQIEKTFKRRVAFS
ncbi:uncharacterized protein LOC118437504 [Folsomia candida]|uniref:uncharacterized protein LOC118437504 n=1 Tax=Folsomia candida TaxID=158441 RepID=UPI00160507F4|nr:uncharacterized protein LOC118437504 [Folsomia candida]